MHDQTSVHVWMDIIWMEKHLDARVWFDNPRSGAVISRSGESENLGEMAHDVSDV